jgi:NTE family protein
MAEYGYHPDWVAGISIGAINSAIIAGNTAQYRVARLRAFWEQVSSPSASWLDSPLETWQDTMRRFSAMSALLFGRPGFFRPNLLRCWDHRDITDELLRYVRSQRNVGAIGRFRPHQRTRDSVQRRGRSVGAVNVRTGNFAYFDNARQTIRPEHVMASGALPPGKCRVRSARV